MSDSALHPKTRINSGIDMALTTSLQKQDNDERHARAMLANLPQYFDRAEMRIVSGKNDNRVDHLITALKDLGLIEKIRYNFWRKK